MKVPYNESIDSFIDFQFVFSFPVTSFFQQSIALINILFDLDIVVLDEIDGDEFECNIHFLADFDCFFECEVVGIDGLCIVLIVVVELCFLEKCVSDFSLAEVLFCVFYFEIDLC